MLKKIDPCTYVLDYIILVFSISGYRYPAHVIDSLNEPENHLYFGFKNAKADVIFS